MERASACSACGALVLRSLQAQHHAFHQHHSHIETVDFRGDYVILRGDEESRLGPPRALGPQ